MSDFKVKMHLIRFWLRLPPDPAGGADSAPLGPTAGLTLTGPTSKWVAGGSVADWLACWTLQKGPGSNRSCDAVG